MKFAADIVKTFIPESLLHEMRNFQQALAISFIMVRIEYSLYAGMMDFLPLYITRSK